MSGYESVSQEHVITTLQGDATIQAYIGGVAGATRILPGFPLPKPMKLTTTERAYLVVEEAVPDKVSEYGNVWRHDEHISIHIYSFTTDRTLRHQISDRIRALFVSRVADLTGQRCTIISEFSVTDTARNEERVRSVDLRFQWTEAVSVLV